MRTCDSIGICIDVCIETRPLSDRIDSIHCYGLILLVSSIYRIPQMMATGLVDYWIGGDWPITAANLGKGSTQQWKQKLKAFAGGSFALELV